MGDTTGQAATSAATHSIKVTRRTERSVYMFCLQHLLKPFGHMLIKPGNPLPAGSPQLEVHKAAKKRCRVRERQVEGIYLYDLQPKDPAVTRNDEKDMQKRLYYFAGGGWQSPPSSDHWKLVSSMAVSLSNTTVTMVSYPLAPNSAAPSSFPQIMRLYETLLREAVSAGEQVVLAGDSAGGNIILSLVLASLAQNPDAPAPTALMAICPSTDLRRTNPEIKKIAPHDPILGPSAIMQTANAWRGNWDASDPRVSPLFGDASLLKQAQVRVHGISGSYDVLGPDALMFRKKCDEAGVRGEWLEWDKQMHCFPLTFGYGLPEGKAAKDWMMDVLNRI